MPGRKSPVRPHHTTDPKLTALSARSVYAAAAEAASGQGHHEGDWIRAIKEGPTGVPPSSPFEYGGALSEMVLLGMLAIRLKDQRLEWDSRNLRKIEYREGWTL
jgi:hypothetical protein